MLVSFVCVRAVDRSLLLLRLFSVFAAVYGYPFVSKSVCVCVSVVFPFVCVREVFSTEIRLHHLEQKYVTRITEV